MKKFASIFLAGIIFFNYSLVASVNAQIYREDFENFKKNNADGTKYEFVKDYLLALDSIGKNRNNYKRWVELLGNKEGDHASQLKQYIDYLKQSNTHFRMAKNLLNKHETSNNGLILKSVRVFKLACDEIVDWNNQERALFTAYYEAVINDKENLIDKAEFNENRKQIAFKRKGAYSKILESTIYIQKILISNVPNSYGEFTRLGITDQERQKLIKRIEGSFGDQYAEGMEEGQTFLGASVGVIRKVLEDYTWPSMDS